MKPFFPALLSSATVPRLLSPLVVLLVLVGTSWAEPAPSSVTTGRPAHLLYVRQAGAGGCPDESQLRAAVAARLGYDPFSPRARRTVMVRVRPVGDAESGGGPGNEGSGGLVARIVLSDELGQVEGSRQIASPRSDCVDLGPTLALVVSMVIDPMNLGPTSPPPASATPSASTPIDPLLDLAAPTPPPEPGSLPPAPSVAPVPEPPPPVVRYRPPLRFRGAVGALVALGTAPSVAPGFALRFGVQGPRWSLSLGARGDLPSGRAFDEGRVTSALVVGELTPCLSVPIAGGRLAFSPCGVLAAGALIAEGHGFLVSYRTVTPYVAAGGRASLELPLGRIFALALHADLLAAITRPRLLVGDSSVWAVPPVAGAFGLDAIFDFR